MQFLMPRIEFVHFCFISNDSRVHKQCRDFHFFFFFFAEEYSFVLRTSKMSLFHRLIVAKFIKFEFIFLSVDLCRRRVVILKSFFVRRQRFMLQNKMSRHCFTHFATPNNGRLHLHEKGKNVYRLKCGLFATNIQTKYWHAILMYIKSQMKENLKGEEEDRKKRLKIEREFKFK